MTIAVEGKTARFRYGRVEVVAGPEGLTVRRPWHGTLVMPWSLIREVRVLNQAPSPQRIMIAFVDGSVRPLPGPTAPVGRHDPVFAATVEEIREIRRLSHALAQPEDAVSPADLARRVRGLAYRGGMRRRGVPQAIIGLFGLLGVLFMLYFGESGFGPDGAFGPPGPCSAAATVTGTASHMWCAVTDAKVVEVDRDAQGGVTELYIGSAAPGSTATADAQFAGAQPAFHDMAVGDPIGFLGAGDWANDAVDFDYGVESVTWHGHTVTTSCTRGCTTAEGDREAALSGLAAALAWPAFFGLWALGRAKHRTLRFVRRVLPGLAACWFVGLIGFVVNDENQQVLTSASLAGLALIAAAIFTAGYSARGVLFPRMRRSSNP